MIATAEVLAALRDGLGVDGVVTDPDIVAAHAQDQARLPAGRPLALLRPADTAAVQRAVRIANQHRVPIVTQGARTSLVGGATAVDDCLLLSTARMNSILQIDRAERVAVVQPGVVNAVLSAAAAEAGLFYPPDPSSWEESTIGGNIATNAGGLCCVKYGVTSTFVRHLEVVLGSGEILRTGSRTIKGVAGFNLTQLLVGSEGTLGIFTEAVVSLQPAPGQSLVVFGIFDDVAKAVRAAMTIGSSGPRPSVLEFMESASIEAVRKAFDLGLPESAGAILIAGSDNGPAAAQDVATMAGILERHGAAEVAIADDDSEAEALMTARRLVAPAVERLGEVMFEDIAVPIATLPTVLTRIAEISERHDVPIPCCGHIGDGNLHPMIVDVDRDESSRSRALAAFDEIMRLANEVGGTIAGEHGIGILKRDALERELGAVSIRLQREIKRVFDPNGILNPGRGI